MAVIHCVSQPPICPPDALPEKPGQFSRCGCVDRSSRRIGYFMAVCLHSQGHFHVLRRMSVSPPAEVAHNRRSEYGKWTWGDEHGAKHGENEAIEYAQCVFCILYMLKDSLGLSHMDSWGYSRYIWIFECGNYFHKSVRVHY